MKFASFFHWFTEIYRDLLAIECTFDILFQWCIYLGGFSVTICLFVRGTTIKVLYIYLILILIWYGFITCFDASEPTR